MKKTVGKCCVYALVLALTAGLFCFLWSLKSEDISENATLVKKICKEGIA